MHLVPDCGPVGKPAVKPRTPRRRWNGGYVHTQKDGRELFIIERQVGHVRYHVSTGAHTWKAALEQLERFETAPHLYVKGGGIEAEAPIYMSDELLEEFTDWQSEHVTVAHAYYTGRYLQAWSDDLAGLDLRKVTLAQLQRALDARKTCRPKRIAAIKVFYGWLRKRKALLAHVEDATLNLPVPQSRPEQYQRKKAVAVDHVRRVARHLRAVSRDCLQLLAGTGLHVSELRRFTLNGAALTVRHKSGEQLTLTLPAHLVAIAKRVQRNGVPPKLSRELKAACRKARVPEFGAGVMRHTVATWLLERGEAPATIARQLGHKDPRTTRRFYQDMRLAVPRLRLPRI